MIAGSALIHPGVVLGKNAVIGAYVILGEAPEKRASQNDGVSVGDNALIRSHSIVYCGNRIGHSFTTGHGVLIREDNQIGDDVSIGSGTVLEHHIRIGNFARVHSRAFIPEFTEIGERCWIGPGAVLTNARYPSSPSAKDNLKGPLLEANAIIGANATILPGIRIGTRSLVGAGAVVTRDVEPDTVVVGNPARAIGKLSDHPEYLNLFGSMP